MFYSSLHVAIWRSSYCNINLRPKQVKCLEAIYGRKDCVAVLPTGYGKSLIFYLLPALLRGKLDVEGPSSPQVVVVIVSPLNALIKDQLRRINERSIGAAALKVKRKQNTGGFELDFGDANPSFLKDAKYDMMFLHPEAFLTCMDGKELLQSAPYQRSVKAIVLDEAHCILERGDDFRKDYSRLAMMFAAFPSAPVLALTATASYKDISIIKESLN